MKITFYPGGQWEGGGMFPVRLQDFRRLAEWISRFLKEVNEIRTHWAASLLNDGILLGQEKANLVNEIDDVIAGLLLFRRYLMEENIEQITAGDGRTFKYNIQILDSLWTGNGELAVNEEWEKLSFADLHNDIIPKKIKIIFARYGAAVGDGNLSDDERKAMHSGIDQLVNDFLRIERNLLCD